MFMNSKKVEDFFALIIFTAMAFFPAIETIARIFGTNIIPASQAIVQHCTLWIGFLGAVLAARRNKLLSLTREPIFNQENNIHFGRWLAKAISFIVIISLAWGSFNLLKIEYTYPFDIAPNIPRWFAMLIMPIGFILMAIQIFFKSYKNNIHRFTLIITSIIFIILSSNEYLRDFDPLVWIFLGLILVALIYGAPIFTGMGGAAVILFYYYYFFHFQTSNYHTLSQHQGYQTKESDFPIFQESIYHQHPETHKILQMPFQELCFLPHKVMYALEQNNI